MPMKTTRQMTSKPSMAPTVIIFFLTLSMSNTQNETRKNVRYPNRKISHGAPVFHQGYSQVSAPTAFNRYSTKTQNTEPTMAKSSRLGMPSIFIFLSLGNILLKVMPKDKKM